MQLAFFIHLIDDAKIICVINRYADKCNWCYSKMMILYAAFAAFSKDSSICQIGDGSLIDDYYQANQNGLQHQTCNFRR